MTDNPFPAAIKLLREKGWQSFLRPVDDKIRICVGIATDESIVRSRGAGFVERLETAYDCLRATTNDNCDQITYHNDIHLPGPNAAHAWLRRAEAEWDRRHGSAT